MHIHSSPLSTQMMAPTQNAEQAAVRRAAAEVRRKLTNFATTDEEEAVSRAEAYAEADPNRRQRPQHDGDDFRSVFFSASA